MSTFLAMLFLLIFVMIIACTMSAVYLAVYKNFINKKIENAGHSTAKVKNSGMISPLKFFIIVLTSLVLLFAVACTLVATFVYIDMRQTSTTLESHIVTEVDVYMPDNAVYALTQKTVPGEDMEGYVLETQQNGDYIFYCYRNETAVSSSEIFGMDNSMPELLIYADYTGEDFDRAGYSIELTQSGVKSLDSYSYNSEEWGFADHGNWIAVDSDSFYGTVDLIYYNVSKGVCELADSGASTDPEFEAYSQGRFETKLECEVY